MIVFEYLILGLAAAVMPAFFITAYVLGKKVKPEKGRSGGHDIWPGAGTG